MLGLHDLVAGLLGHGVDGNLNAQHGAELILNIHGHIVEVGSLGGQQHQIGGNGAQLSAALVPQLLGQLGIIIGDVALQLAEGAGAVAVDALGDDAARGHSAGHEHLVDQGLAVDGEAQRLAHLGVQTIVGVIELQIVVAEVAVGAELRIAHIEHDVGGGQVHAVDLAGLIGIQRSGRVGDDLDLDAVQLDVLSVPVVLVLHHGHADADVHGGDDERTAAHDGIGAGGVGVAHGGVELLVQREHGGQRGHAIEEGGGRGQGSLEGLVVNGLYADLGGVALAVHVGLAVLQEGRDGGGVAVVLGVADLGDPGKLEILRGDRRAVAPGDAVAQGEGVGQTIVGHGVALGQRGLGIAVSVQADQALGEGAGDIKEVAVRRGHLIEGAEDAVGIDVQHILAVRLCKAGDAGKQHAECKHKRQHRLFHVVCLLNRMHLL